MVPQGSRRHSPPSRTNASMQKLHKFLMQSARAFVLAMYFAPVILTLPLYKFFPSFHDRWWDLLVKAIEVRTLAAL